MVPLIGALLFTSQQIGPSAQMPIVTNVTFFLHRIVYTEPKILKFKAFIACLLGMLCESSPQNLLAINKINYDYKCI